MPGRCVVGCEIDKERHVGGFKGLLTFRTCQVHHAQACYLKGHGLSGPEMPRGSEQI